MSIGQFMPLFAGVGDNTMPDIYADYVVMDLRFDDIGMTMPVDTSAFANPFIANTTISTVSSPKKFGEGAGLFNGSGNQALSQPYVVPLYGDFSVEFWQYCTARKGSDACLFDLRKITENYEPYLVLYNAGGVALAVQNNFRMTTPNTPLNQWNHISVNRLGGFWYLYLNGVRVPANYSQTSAFSEMRFVFGTYTDQYTGQAAYHYNGLLDNFRMWNGVAIRGGLATFEVPKLPYEKLKTDSILTGGAQFTSVFHVDNGNNHYWGYYRSLGKGTYTGSLMTGYELDMVEGNYYSNFAYTGVIATLENRTLLDFLRIRSRGAKNGLALTPAAGGTSILLEPPQYNSGTGRISWSASGSISNTIGNPIFRQGNPVNVTPR